MRIGILSKREGNFTGKLRLYLQSKGHEVRIYTLKNLKINQELLDNDFFILKSKQLFFLYAGYFIESNNFPIYPSTEIAFKHKNRIEAHFLIKKAGFLSPNIYLGTKQVLTQNLTYSSRSYIQKPIMSSGSKGVGIVTKSDDIEAETDEIIYLEDFISGIHYLAYFIKDNIFVYEKEPLANEHAPVKEIELTNDLKSLVIRWKNEYNLLFGHLDLVKEKNTDKIYIVDIGCFPEFSHWKNIIDAVNSVGNLILNFYYKNSKRIN
ncbi:MAG: hypothetical protein EU533_02525 [Promethearchaeota archaeon]|nr:MAG: hypothetical protein EU533_02525 [Candidatus Lokiarchaeota archaeon]